jgi:hypothetical protein
MLKKGLLILSTLFITNCTNADFVQLTSYGSPGHIVCYSGGKVIYDGYSTGKIATEQQSDGWYFEDAKTRKLVRVSGDCLIEN